MHAVCLSGSIKMFDLLVSSQSQFDLKDKRGMLPIHYAVIRDKVDLLIHMQTKKGVNVSAKRYYYKDKFTLLAVAVLNSAYKVVMQLVEWGEPLDAKDSEGNTYLHLAAQAGNLNVFLYFLNKQMNIRSKNEKGKDPSEILKEKKHKHIINFLKKHIEDQSVNLK